MIDFSLFLFFFSLDPLPFGLLLWPVATVSNYGMQSERKKRGRKEGDTFRIKAPRGLSQPYTDAHTDAQHTPNTQQQQQQQQFEVSREPFHVSALYCLFVLFDSGSCAPGERWERGRGRGEEGGEEPIKSAEKA